MNNKLIFKCKEFVRLSIARMRAHFVRFQGARVGRKCLIGSGVRIDRPWTAKFGLRCVLDPQVWIDTVSDNASFQVGDYTFIGRGAHIFISEMVSIGSNCLIGDGVIISDHKHNIEQGKLIGSQGCTSDPVDIEDDVMLSVRSIILQGVSIGKGAVVGPGAVVTGNIPPYSIAAGAPARIVGKR